MTDSNAATPAQSAPDVFPVPMPLSVILCVLLLALAAAGLTAWFFKGHMFMAGSVMIVIFTPLLSIAWYALYMKPKDTRILAGDGTLVVEAPPYFTATFQAGSIRKAYRCRLDQEEHLAGLTKDSGVSAGPYRAGIFKGKGRETVIVCRRKELVCLVTDERLVALGPRDPEALAAAIERRLGVKVE